MIKPSKLIKGDTIGIISPSQSILLEEEQTQGFEKGIKKLEGLGFKVLLGKHAKGKYFYSAGTPKERVEDLHQMFLDPQVKAIIMSIGGETANELLPLMDFGLIKNHPKIIMGMSDGTNILAPITDKAGFITFYGPDLIYEFGIQENTEDFDKQIMDCLMGQKPEWKPLNNLIDDDGVKLPLGWQTIRKGATNGRLMGGYLEEILCLMATGYLKNIDNTILYLESMEGSNTIHMRLQYLKMMGLLDKINGLILGYFPDIEKNKTYFRPIGDIILELTADKNFPILQVNELGHQVKNYVWPNGLEVELDSTNKKITALGYCVG